MPAVKSMGGILSRVRRHSTVVLSVNRQLLPSGLPAAACDAPSASTSNFYRTIRIRCQGVATTRHASPNRYSTHAATRLTGVDLGLALPLRPGTGWWPGNNFWISKSDFIAASYRRLAESFILRANLCWPNVAPFGSGSLVVVYSFSSQQVTTLWTASFSNAEG